MDDPLNGFLRGMSDEEQLARLRRAFAGLTKIVEAGHDRGFTSEVLTSSEDDPCPRCGLAAFRSVTQLVRVHGEVRGVTWTGVCRHCRWFDI